VGIGAVAVSDDPNQGRRGRRITPLESPRPLLYFDASCASNSRCAVAESRGVRICTNPFGGSVSWFAKASIGDAYRLSCGGKTVCVAIGGYGRPGYVAWSVDAVRPRSWRISKILPPGKIGDAGCSPETALCTVTNGQQEAITSLNPGLGR